MEKRLLIVAAGIWVLYVGLLDIHIPDWLYSFRPGALGDAGNVVVPYWALLLAWLPAHLPEPLGYALWTGVGLLLVLLTARYLQASPWLLLFSYQLHWILFYGQIDPFVIFGLGLGYWAANRGKPYLLGIAIMLALVKPQVGLLSAVAFFSWSSDRRKTLAVCGAIFLASLAIWPSWLIGLWQNHWIEFLGRTENIRANTTVNLPLWLSLPLAAGVLLSRLERRRKFVALVAANLLVSPYATIYSQLALLSLGLPAGFYVFGLIPWPVALALGPFNHWSWAVLFPLSVLLYTYKPTFSACFQILHARLITAHPAAQP